MKTETEAQSPVKAAITYARRTSSQFHHAGDEKADSEHRRAEAKDVEEVGQPGEEVSAHMGLFGEALDVAAYAETYP